jgi:hypothetical protein
MIALRGELKLAVAYWGAGSLDLLGLKPSRSNLTVVCCLKGGKSDPDVIEKFGRRIKQNDRLHAKVIWTPRGAIVSSANASSNGLPEEEGISQGLIEAGIFVSDEPELSSIKQWIGELYDKAKPIGQKDLQNAREARAKRVWDGSGGGKSPSKKQSLIQALRDGGPIEFDKQRIFVALFKEQPTQKELAAARKNVNANQAEISSAYNITASQFDELDWYFNWPQLPSDAFLIDLECNKKRWLAHRVYKSFNTRRTWPSRCPDGGVDRLTLVQQANDFFSYRLTASDKKLIARVGDQLWKKAKGDGYARVISLKEAAPIILQHE